MPDIFVPEDTTGYTSYYIEANNMGLIQKFARDMADSYRPMMKGTKSKETMARVMARDSSLLTAFVNYAAARGLPARWYYINKSRDLLINQIKACIARDLVGYETFIEILNEKDAAVARALKDLSEGKSPVIIR